MKGFIMISAYFGYFGSGKTTYLCKLAFDESKKIDKGISKYKHILTNVKVQFIPHVTFIDVHTLGIYDYSNSLILIDESSVYFSNRTWDRTSSKFLDYVALHRHYKDDFKHENDIVLFLQTINGYDKRLRELTQNLYYMKKVLFWTDIIKIPYTMVFPEKDDVGEVNMGYARPTLMDKLLCKRFIRKKYYKYYDSLSKDLPLLHFDKYLD